jgi:hypothetical protein
MPPETLSSWYLASRFLKDTVTGALQDRVERITDKILFVSKDRKRFYPSAEWCLD